MDTDNYAKLDMPIDEVCSLAIHLNTFGPSFSRWASALVLMMIKTTAKIKLSQNWRRTINHLCTHALQKHSIYQHQIDACTVYQQKTSLETDWA